MVGRGPRQHERHPRERDAHRARRAPAFRRRARHRSHRAAPGEGRGVIAVTRRRPELGLLFWVAALGITGSVAVAAAEVAGFRPQQLVIPVTYVVIAFALHVFLAARGVRGDQLPLPSAAALTASGLVLVQRLASHLLAPQLP